MTSNKQERYHHGDLRAEIIRVATALVASKGVDGVTLRAIASDLSVSRAAPYRHFKDKHELLCAIANEGFKLLLLQLKLRLTESEQQTALKQIWGLGEAYCQFAFENPAYYQLMFMVPEINQNPNEQLKQSSDHSFKFLCDALNRCQESEQVIEEALVFQARFVWSSLHGYCCLVLQQGRKQSQEFIDHRDYFLTRIVSAIKC